MFNFDDDMSGPRTVIRFSYTNYNDDGDIVSSVERTVRDDDAEFLGNLLHEFRMFLWQMTFNYIENVVATTDGGNEITADDNE